jgi:hypothetical protein
VIAVEPVAEFKKQASISVEVVCFFSYKIVYIRDARIRAKCLGCEPRRLPLISLLGTFFHLQDERAFVEKKRAGPKSRPLVQFAG